MSGVVGVDAGRRWKGGGRDRVKTFESDFEKRLKVLESKKKKKRRKERRKL